MRRQLVLACTVLVLSSLAARSQDVCQGRAATVTLGKVQVEGTTVKASGSWTASPGTHALGLEYRVDSDRQVLEVRTGESGEWSVSIPFPLCGRHVFRVDVFPAIDGAGGVRTLCFEGP